MDWVIQDNIYTEKTPGVGQNILKITLGPNMTMKK